MVVGIIDGAIDRGNVVALLSTVDERGIGVDEGVGREG